MGSIKAMALLMSIVTVNSGAVRIPESAHNLLLEAKVSGNLESFDKGLRGAADHIIYDNQTWRFVKESQWHEYGVGFGEDLGIVAEDKGAWWMARWKELIKANLIVFSGVYDNQPQPNTAWKIELRREGKWRVHARGVGGWYDRGQYVWGGPETEAITFDALRVSTFSKDKQTSIQSIHYRGEKGMSWVVAYCPPIDARIAPAAGPIRAGEAMAFEATVYPTFVLVGKFGRVRYRGKCPDARLKDWVATLDAEKADPGADVALLGAVKLDAPKLLAQTTLPDLAGNKTNLGGAMGPGGLLVMFVDTKCPFSAHAMKDMPTVAGKLLSMKINSVLINVCDPEKDVKAFFKKRNVGAQVIYDETSKTNDYWNVYSVPRVIFISPAKEIGYNGNALWADVAGGIEKVKGFKPGTINFKAKGTGFG